MITKKIWWRVIIALLLAVAAGGYWGWYSEYNQVTALKLRIIELQKQELRSAIDKSVSEQLEVIASQQKNIAEEKTEEANIEKQRADEAFKRSEKERMKAELAEIEARQEKEKAEAERHRADVARRLAEKSEQLAKEERDKADTLRYHALAHSLGSASHQAMTANQLDLARLLAYYSYRYITKYNGEVFHPDIFQSMLEASNSLISLHKHRGEVRDMDFMPVGDDRLVSVCDNGQMLIHTKVGNDLRTVVLFDGKKSDLFKNGGCDFRYLYINKKSVIFALSRSGHLFVNKGGHVGNTRIIPVLEDDFPMAFWVVDDSHVIVVGEHNLAMVDLSKSNMNAVVDIRNLGFKVISFGKYNNSFLLFDNQHRQHLVKNFNEIESSEIPIAAGKVTSFRSTGNNIVYGMEDGTIWLRKSNSSYYQQLIGHESRISTLKIVGDRLFSSSYDGKVNLWYLNNEKIVPIEVMSRHCWILNLAMNNSGQAIWVGDKNGSLTGIMLDVKKVSNTIETVLKQEKRDFNKEEWNYYIGKTTPYEPLILKNGKEDEK